MHVEIERIRRSAAREQPQQSSGLGTVSNQPTKYLDSWPGTEVGNRKKGCILTGYAMPIRRLDPPELCLGLSSYDVGNASYDGYWTGLGV